MAEPRTVSRQRYAAPAYPFGATVGSVFGAKDDVSVVVTSIINILTTLKGTYAPVPRLGSLVGFLIFEPLDEINMSLIRYFTFKDLTEQEPRIVLRGVFARREGNHRVVLQVGFSLIGDPTGRTYGIPVRVSTETVGGI